MAGFLLETEAIFYYFIVGFGASILSFCLVNFFAIVAFNAPVGTLLAGFLSSLKIFLLFFLFCCVSTFPSSLLQLAQLCPPGVTITISNVLAGFFIPKDEIPPWWIWGYWTSFVHYPLEGLTVNELSDMEFNCGSDGTEGAIAVPVGTNVQYYCSTTNGNQLLDALSMDADHKWPYLGVTYGLMLVLVLLCWVALQKVIHISR